MENLNRLLAPRPQNHHGETSQVRGKDGTKELTEKNLFGLPWEAIGSHEFVPLGMVTAWGSGQANTAGIT